MSTIKISELPKFTTINANTANTLFVGIDIPSAQTFQFSAGTLAEGLFANTALVVGNNRIIYPSTTAQFSGEANSYLQLNLQNFENGIYSSSDFVASTSDSDNATRYIDMGIGNPQYNDPVNYSAFKAYDGYVYVYGPGQNSSQGNLILGTASSNAIIQFIVGGTMSPNIVGWMTKTGLKLNTQSYITFSDGTTQTTAAASNAYSQAAFALANTTVTNQAAINATQNTSITAAFTQANTATTNAAAASLYANSAFTKANNALANTSGTFAGDLTITGNTVAQKVNTANLVVNGTTNISGTLNVIGAVTMNTTLVLANSNFSATEAALTIKATANNQTPSNDGYMLHISGKQNVASRIVIDSFSATGNAYGLIAGRTARGTVDTPLAIANNDVLLRVSGNGYGNTSFASFGTSRIDMVASENYTDALRGSRIEFWNIPIGSNTFQKIATFNGDSVHFSGVVNPEKGFIFTPRSPAGNQTAITIDYNTDVIIKANLVADLTVSHTNFIAGKSVEVWLTNSGGTQRTVTHGISAINSTTNSLTFSIPATSSAYMKFFSIDGDLANTFVTVTNA